MRKHVDRFNGVTEQELYDRSLNDLIDYNLDIVFVNINPGLYSVYKGHHYSGPGNHFWRCLYDSGLTNKILKSSDDYKILEFKMGLMNMIQKPNIKSCQELTEDEIKQAQESLNKRVRIYRPKIVAFNGKTIYEIYTGSSVDKEFNFGKQPIKFDNNTTDTYMYVMPSSSARCSQLPKVIDKVPFYSALLKFREYLNGYISDLSDLDIMFPDFKVALEVDKNGNDAFENGKRKSQGNGDFFSDSADENSLLEDSIYTPINPNETVTGHKIKFVRLNNIPYSQIPADILANLQAQRKLKKNLTITTTRNLFNSNSRMSIGAHRQNNNQAFNSDYDTMSTATCDSSDGSAKSVSNEIVTHPVVVDVVKPILNTSKLSSLILNVCNSNSNSSTPTQSIQQQQQTVEPNNQTSFSVSIQNNICNKISSPVINPVNDIKPLNQTQPVQPLPLKLTNNCTTIKQILAAPLNLNLTNQRPLMQVITKNNVSEMNKPIQMPTNKIISQIQQPPLQAVQLIAPNTFNIQLNNKNNLNQNSIVAKSVNNFNEQLKPAPNPKQMDIECKENNLFIYEAFKPSKKLISSDYYTFDSYSQYPLNTLLNDEYSSLLNYELNQVIQLYYGDEMR